MGGWVEINGNGNVPLSNFDNGNGKRYFFRKFESNGNGNRYF